MAVTHCHVCPYYPSVLWNQTERSTPEKSDFLLSICNGGFSSVSFAVSQGGWLVAG
ncbi:MAG: hypothetical protein JW863_09745 [Chitinispirillaceae bacterium]|nr:hypothetical protein [Chitinispirillaceae bacterium]